MVKELSFENLAVNVSQIHELTSGKAKNAVNQLLTVRNWAIGYYIVEYEQNGKDRAEYGVHVLSNLANRLQIKGLDRTMLNLCRIFYLKYPQLCESVNHILHIDGYATAQLIISEMYDTTAIINGSEICDSMNHIFQTDPDAAYQKTDEKESTGPDAADQPSDGNSSIDSDAAVQKSDDKERSGQDGTAAEVTSEEIKTENYEEETPAEKTAG